LLQRGLPAHCSLNLDSRRSAVRLRQACFSVPRYSGSCFPTCFIGSLLQK